VEWQNYHAGFSLLEGPIEKVTEGFTAVFLRHAPKMFAVPRVKKSALQPPPKKRKITHKIEEITFDKDARTEYLSGFRKRKQARIKEAKEIAAKKEREERIEMRKQVRDEFIYLPLTPRL
jgi:hypothetical protein